MENILVRNRINEHEIVGFNLIQHFFSKMLVGKTYKLTQTKSGWFYDADLFVDALHILIEYKGRNIKYYPSSDGTLMFDFDKIEKMRKISNRDAYLYITFFGEYDIFLINLDKKGILEGMCGFEGVPLPENTPNRYGVFYAKKFVKKIFVDDNSGKILQTKLFIPAKLFKHFTKIDGNWKKIN